jgi:hypothetical protein
MANYTGEVIVRLSNLEANDPKELEKALTWLMPVLASQIYGTVANAPKTKAEVSVSGTSGPQGASGTVSVSGNVGGGTVTGSVTHASGGGTSGTVTGTWRF